MKKEKKTFQIQSGRLRGYFQGVDFKSAFKNGLKEQKNPELAIIVKFREKYGECYCPLTKWFYISIKDSSKI